jgi:hypothetical protein
MEVTMRAHAHAQPYTLQNKGQKLSKPTKGEEVCSRCCHPLLSGMSAVDSSSMPGGLDIAANSSPTALTTTVTAAATTALGTFSFGYAQ